MINRVQAEEITEVILALNATIDGQTTVHYIADQLEGQAERHRWPKVCPSAVNWIT